MYKLSREQLLKEQKYLSFSRFAVLAAYIKVVLEDE